MKKVIYLALIATLIGCKPDIKVVNIVKATPQKIKTVIQILPFSDVDQSKVVYLTSKLKEVFDSVAVLKSEDIPKQSYYKPRNRYRANNILDYMKYNYKGNVVAITEKDISIPTKDIPDHGILGLGSLYTNKCIISSYRCKKKNINFELYKLALHEIGHTFTINHCPEASCTMNAGNKTNNLKPTFCNKCKSFLIKAGWRLK